MTEDEVVDLLAIAQVFDKRTVGEAEVTAWADSAHRGRWTFNEASEAIKDYYARTTAEKPWIMPSHITHMVRAEREHRAMRAQTRELVQPSPRMNELIEKAARNTYIPNELREPKPFRQPALRVKCEHCGSEPGESCSRPTREGRRVPCKPHPSRQVAGELQETT